MNIQFYKYQGTGNDFVILDNRNEQYNHLSKQQITFLCDRRFGVGADGLMLLSNHKDFDFEMVYYNSDGSQSMCGNGGRCLVKFAKDMGINKRSYHFLAIDGPHEADFDQHGWVQLRMKDVKEIKNSDGDCIVNTGSPHYVKIVASVKDYDVFGEGKRIRNTKEFKHEGINVNFVEVQNHQIWVRTYERGVENETLSCGTGVTASALACAHNALGYNRVEVETLGGHLAVEFEKHAEGSFTDVWLCGPAINVFKGEIELS